MINEEVYNNDTDGSDDILPCRMRGRHHNHHKPEDNEGISLTYTADFYDNFGGRWLSVEGKSWIPHKLFSERLETECEVSMALTGALRVSLDGKFININVQTKSVDWVKWSGDYEELKDYIEKSISVIKENEEKIGLLMQSYRE